MLRNKLLIACIIAGLVAALGIVYQRHQIETAGNTVELVMDYEDVVDLAATEGVALPEMMRQLREAGIFSLAVYDMTLEKLNKSGLVFSLGGAELMQRYQTGVPSEPALTQLAQTGQVAADRVYVFGPPTQTFEEVKQDLIRRLGEQRVREIAAGSPRILEIKGNYEKLIKSNLGLSTAEMALIAQNGFHVVPRPTNYAHVTANDVDEVFNRISTQKQISTLFFVGEEVLGYKPQLERTAAYMREHGVVLGLIEHPLQLQFLKQDGLIDLAKLLDYQAARVYVIPKDEQPKLKVREAVERWVLSDRERNIRVNLIRIYTKPEGNMSLLETNLTYVQETRKALEGAGFSLGRAGAFPNYYPARLTLSLVILGACAGGVLLLGELLPLNGWRQILLLAGTFLLLAGPVLMGHGNVARQAAALGSAVIFPGLAMAWQIKKWRRSGCKTCAGGRILWLAFKGVAQASLVSLIGGVFVAAVLADARYFLEIEIFRGVKLTFVLPLLIVTVLFFRQFGFEEDKPAPAGGFLAQVKRVLDQPVLFKYLLALAVAAVAAIVYVGRSGHTAGIPVPALETKMRALLEQLFYARPRTREFLIGHPAFFLATLAVCCSWSRVWQFALVIAASMAQISLVETFAHLRTPVMMTFVRGFDGWVLGTIIGMVAVIVLQGVIRVAVQLGRRTVGHG
ncbi:MAG TPA: hypothetical protein DEA44_01110 [Firmicutes bacterium]|nr:hypothetical protein [Bacillota bacterium]